MAAAQDAQPHALFNPNEHGTALWQEEDYITALAILEDVQHQTATARMIPHQLIYSLTRGPKLASHLHRFAHFAESVQKARQDINVLERLWEDPRMSQIVMSAKLAHHVDPDPSGGDSVPLFGWKQRMDALSTPSRVLAAPVAVDGGDDNGAAGVEVWEHAAAVVDDMLDHFESLVWLDVAQTRLQAEVTQLTTPPSSLLFTILATPEGYRVNCTNNYAVSRVVEDTYGLRYLLEMLADYKTLKIDKCARCSNRLDTNGNPPVVRIKDVSQNSWYCEHEKGQC